MDHCSRPHRVLFRLAAGPRVGFGHLVRAVSLADAMRVPAVLSIRASHPSTARSARALGAVVVEEAAATTVLDRVRPDVLIVDDRVAQETVSWRRAARRRQVPIVSIHDLGLGLGDADLVVDGSIGAPAVEGTRPALLGTRYAILNPRTVGARPSQARVDVLIALGGGPRRSVAIDLAHALRVRRPGLRIAAAGGFVAGDGPRSVSSALRWVKPADLGAAIAAARVAVVGGGVTLYECLARGVPCVALSVVPSQRPTVAAFAERGAAVDGGLAGAGGPGATSRLAARVLALLDDEAGRRRMRGNGRRLVDGRGAARVARAIGRLVGARAARKVGER